MSIKQQDVVKERRGTRRLMTREIINNLFSVLSCRLLTLRVLIGNSFNCDSQVAHLLHGWRQNENAGPAWLFSIANLE